jgi:hypothetical protein
MEVRKNDATKNLSPNGGAKLISYFNSSINLNLNQSANGNLTPRE